VLRQVAAAGDVGADPQGQPVVAEAQLSACGGVAAGEFDDLGGRRPGLVLLEY
jgi:hypothetical protein